MKKPPVILVINDDEELAKSWSQNIAGFVKSAGGGDPEMIFISGKQAMRNRTRILGYVRSRLQEMLQEGKKPDLIITDNGLDAMGLASGSDLEEKIRGENFFEKQKELWPEGTAIPMVVISGHPDFAEYGRMTQFSNNSSLFISSAAMNALSDNTGLETEKYLAAKLCGFISKALGISSPDKPAFT